jgi:hypothetical protein
MLVTDLILCFRGRAMAGTEQDDQDSGKGAVETDGRDAGANTSMEGQQGHRGNMTGSDSDFPEPDAGPEHSGEPVVDDDDTAA